MATSVTLKVAGNAAQTQPVIVVPATAPADVNAYVKMEDDETSTTEVYMKYDATAWFFMIGAILFFVLWIVWILTNVFRQGASTSYCKAPAESCYRDSYATVPACCYTNGRDKTCWNPAAEQCVGLSTTISTFVVQFVLIPLIVIYIILLLRSLKSGITIIAPETQSHPLAVKLMAYKEMITIDCRKYLHQNKEHPQKTAIDFLWNSFIALSVFRLIEDLPIILFNMLSNDPVLNAVGKVKLGSDVFGIIINAWGSWGPCCNPFRGRCCGNKCFCDVVFDFLFCRCMCGHFPEHHVPYVRSLASVISFTQLLKLADATAQVGAVGFVKSTDDRHLWLLGLNYIYGVIVIVNVYKVKWRYYYLMCFYWSRWAVNKYENHKIHEMLNELLVGGFIFRVKVEKEDQFITVLETENIAPKVGIKCDCWVFIWATYFFITLFGVVTLFWNSTMKLNQNFNLDIWAV